MKKILIAETLKTFIADDRALERNDVVIVSAATVEEILSAHRTDRADLIIADLDMPESGGDRLCYLIRREQDLRAVSIIIVCDCSEEVRERCIAFGANAVVQKPVRSEDLLGKIKSLLDIRERKAVREIVKISVAVSSPGIFFFAIAKNLSGSGLLFETNRIIRKGSRVTCSFVLQHQVVADGEIARICRTSGKSGDNFEYGVRFIGLDSSGKMEVEDYCRSITGK